MPDRRRPAVKAGGHDAGILPQIRFLVFGKGPGPPALPRWRRGGRPVFPDAETAPQAGFGDGLGKGRLAPGLEADAHGGGAMFFHDHDYEPALLQAALSGPPSMSARRAACGRIARCARRWPRGGRGGRYRAACLALRADPFGADAHAGGLGAGGCAEPRADAAAGMSLMSCWPPGSRGASGRRIAVGAACGRPLVAHALAAARPPGARMRLAVVAAPRSRISPGRQGLRRCPCRRAARAGRQPDRRAGASAQGWHHPAAGGSGGHAVGAGRGSARAAGAGWDQAACVTCDGVPGPPAVFPQGMFDALARLSGDRGAGALLRQIPRRAPSGPCRRASARCRYARRSALSARAAWRRSRRHGASRTRLSDECPGPARYPAAMIPANGDEACPTARPAR